MWTSPRKIMFFMGLLVILAGALPLVVQYNLVVLPSLIPVSGWKYQAIVIVLGVLLMIFGKPTRTIGLGIPRY